MISYYKLEEDLQDNVEETHHVEGNRIMAESVYTLRTRIWQRPACLKVVELRWHTQWHWSILEICLYAIVS